MQLWGGLAVEQPKNNNSNHVKCDDDDNDDDEDNSNPRWLACNLHETRNIFRGIISGVVARVVC